MGCRVWRRVLLALSHGRQGRCKMSLDAHRTATPATKNGLAPNVSSRSRNPTPTFSLNFRALV